MHNIFVSQIGSKLIKKSVWYHAIDNKEEEEDTTAAATQQRGEDDYFLSWRRSTKNEKGYPVLNNDREYISWKIKFERKIHSNEMYQMINSNFHKSSLHKGSDTELHKKQINFFATVLLSAFSKPKKEKDWPESTKMTLIKFGIYMKTF